MSVIVRTHGGFGNQIFQVFFARLYAEQCGSALKELHDDSYYHSFPRSPALRPATRALTWQERAISNLRIPKILQKANLRTEQPLNVFRSFYLDGYFQELASYARFDDAQVRTHLKDLASELLIGPASKDQTLVHIRLGDFFKTRESARSHAVARLQNADNHSAIMTNDEELLHDPEIVKILDEKRCEIVSSSGAQAEQVLRLMATYRRIDANDSTLVFWASVLGGCKTRFENKRLKPTHEYFTRIFRP